MKGAEIGNNLIGRRDQHHRFRVTRDKIQRRRQDRRTDVAHRRFDHDRFGIQPFLRQLFGEAQKAKILEALDAALEATGFVPEQTWGERIEDRGSQITFSALGQQVPIHAKGVWDSEFAKRKII